MEEHEVSEQKGSEQYMHAKNKNSIAIHIIMTIQNTTEEDPNSLQRGKKGYISIRRHWILQHQDLGKNRIVTSIF